jgi:transcriptional regulator with XRE-family HTH domain
MKKARLTEKRRIVMSVGKNIRYHRKRRGITQKELGRRVGFPVAAADVRIAQYENDSRCPKEPLLRAMAVALGVSPAALSAPDFDDPAALMNTLLSLEERFSLTVLQEGSVTRIQM